jgi:hypothetical protein
MKSHLTGGQYVAAPPDIAGDVSFVREWTNPKQGISSATKTAIVAPGIQEVISYLEALYHGLPVKSLRSLNFASLPGMIVSL